jgi:uncharacterized protein DUF1353
MFDSELSIRAVGPVTWELTAPLVWTGREGDPFVVPAGFVTDFATVPRFLHWLWLPYGAYTRAAVLHDWLLVELAHWWQAAPKEWGDEADAWMNAGPPADSHDIDGIFRAAMRDLGVSWLKRWTGWTAVRWASLFNPRRAYGRRFGQDAPRVLGMTVLVAVPVAFGAIPVLLVLGLARLATWATGGPPPARIHRRGRPAGKTLKGN